jgi:hypothetical protein
MSDEGGLPPATGGGGAEGFVEGGEVGVPVFFPFEADKARIGVGVEGGEERGDRESAVAGQDVGERVARAGVRDTVLHVHMHEVGTERAPSDDGIFAAFAPGMVGVPEESGAGTGGQKTPRGGGIEQRIVRLDHEVDGPAVRGAEVAPTGEFGGGDGEFGGIGAAAAVEDAQPAGAEGIGPRGEGGEFGAGGVGRRGEGEAGVERDDAHGLRADEGSEGSGRAVVGTEIRREVGGPAERAQFDGGETVGRREAEHRVEREIGAAEGRKGAGAGHRARREQTRRAGQSGKAPKENRGGRNNLRGWCSYSPFPPRPRVCDRRAGRIHASNPRPPMTKSTRLMITAAALAGLYAGALASSAGAAETAKPGAADTAKKDAGKHECKGKNTCKGQGGCGASDNGCKGKNTCKGKGGCSTMGKKDEKKTDKK